MDSPKPATSKEPTVKNFGPLDPIWVVAIISNTFGSNMAILRPGMYLVGNKEGCAFIPTYFPERLEVAELKNVYGDEEDAMAARDLYNEEQKARRY